MSYDDCIARRATVGSPSEEPLTLTEAKKQCDVPSGDSSHDTFLTSLITAARETWERDTGVVCVTSTVTEIVDELEDEFYELSKRPVQSVTSIYYRSTTGASTLWASSEYTLDTRAAYAMVFPNYATPWPVVRGYIGDVTITYVAGYASASVVPQVWKQAMLLLVSHWFENRGVGDVPEAYDRLAANWRRSTYP